jgi:hypothetical protein
VLLWLPVALCGALAAVLIPKICSASRFEKGLRNGTDSFHSDRG